ncbi:hypothetical protein R5W23_001389 [Gemmata sp. JC673]|uniref:Uncharacterized protein n=1 Tax=Gemmata algarum TaxID=2975278 RepID=A0ABU5EYY4_9BACT|nr:hypothetical protein [Gemmata algarum]MDY3560164.1 hypothetical protein [Gemmata algarum]
MGRSRLIAFGALCLLSAAASAEGIMPVSNPQSDWGGRSGGPKIQGLGVEADALRNRMMRWRERDFRALFGEPFKPVEKEYALMTTEPRWLITGGVRVIGAPDKSHTASYRLGTGVRIDVSFGADGDRPGYIVFYPKVDDGFVRFDRHDRLERRITWERAALWKAVRHTDDRWREVVGWEIDPVRAGELARGLDTLDPAEKLKATAEWAEKQGMRLNTHSTSPKGDTLRRWYRGGKVLVEVQCDGDGHGNEGAPHTFTLYRANGSRLRHESAGPHTPSEVTWYRADDSPLRSELRHTDRVPGCEATWCWFVDGRVVRLEKDTNGDGIPDELTERPGGKEGEVPGQPLVIEKSWAVHPELIPADLRLPDQTDRRVPVRRIAE